MWRVSLVCLVLAAAVAWHISLLWLFRDAPAVLPAVLLTLFGLVVAARSAARATPAAARTRAMSHAARLDGVGLAFVACLLVLLALFHVGFERAAADGRAYFIQVRSLVMDQDLDLANDDEAFGTHGADQYPIGAPLLWSPFYVAGHVWILGAASFGVEVRPDGYYYPYQRAIGLATLFYGFVGLVLAYRVVRVYFPRGIAALGTIGLCLTSFLVWYLTVENSMVHGVSMFSTTLFLFLWHRMRPAPTTTRWTGLGVAAGARPRRPAHAERHLHARLQSPRAGDRGRRDVRRDHAVHLRARWQSLLAPDRRLPRVALRCRPVDVRPPARPNLLRPHDRRGWRRRRAVSRQRQIVEVVLNGEQVAAVRLNDGVNQDVVDLPASLLRSGFNHVVFRYRFAVSPESLGVSADTRTLAVLVSRLRFRPAQPN